MEPWPSLVLGTRLLPGAEMQRRFKSCRFHQHFYGSVLELVAETRLLIEGRNPNAGSTPVASTTSLSSNAQDAGLLNRESELDSQ